MTNFKLKKDSTMPLHLQLLDELRHNIFIGTLKPGDRLPSEWELVTELNISRATIQRAWQAAQDEGLIYRVMGKGTFIAEPPTKVTSPQAIGFIIPEYRSLFAMQMLGSVERVMRKHSYQVIFAHTDRNISEENRVLEQMKRDGVSGVLLTPARGEVVGRYINSPQYSLPTVFIDRPIPGLSIPCVSSDNYSGALQAMHHLMSIGHRNILFVAQPTFDLWTVSERYRAYRDVLIAHGQTPHEAFLFSKDQELSTYEAYSFEDELLDSLATLLTSPERPTAIFAVNDYLALQVRKAIQKAKLRVPKDISLVGFDNLQITEHIDPPLTTIAQDGIKIGEQAALRLLSMINGEKELPLMTVVPTRLIVRSSTAPLASTSGQN